MSPLPKARIRGVPRTAQAGDADVDPLAARRLIQIDLASELPERISATDETSGRSYGACRVLVRLHTYPLGLVECSIPAGGLSREALVSAVETSLKDAVAAHHQSDGLTSAADPLPDCLRQRASFLRDAPFVSVIIPTHERRESLKRCLTDLLAMEYPADRYEILVVDNVPRTSGTYETVQQLGASDERIRYLRCDVPGSASARNVGVEEARGRHVVFTDDDVDVDAHWLTEMVRGFFAADNVGAVTGLVLPSELETPAQMLFEQYGGFSKGFSQRTYDLGRHRPSDPLFPYRAGAFGSGNSMAFDRDVLLAIGGFDPSLGNGTPTLGGVDIEAFLRVVLCGHTLVYQPSAIVRHLHRREYSALRKQLYSYGVGLTAVLTCTLAARPRLAFDVACKLPRGLWFALSPGSPKNIGRAGDYPWALKIEELRGMVYGPFAYWRSRRSTRTGRGVASAPDPSHSR